MTRSKQVWWVAGAILLGILVGLLCQTQSAKADVWLPPAKYATEYTLYFGVYDSNSPWRNYETAPAAADIHVFQNGASEARATNAVTDIGRTFKLVLTAGEMTAAVVTVDINDATATPLFGDETWYIPTYGHASALQAFDLDSATVTPGADSITASVLAANAITSSELATSAADEIADEAWDEKLNGGGHRIKHSAAYYLRLAARSSGGGDTIVLEDGTAQAGGDNTITLAADASATNDIYGGMLIALMTGTGAPQTRIVVGYVGATKVATVDKNWVTNPDVTTTYQIMADAGSFYSDQGTAQAGDATTITLASTASAVNDIYNGFFCRIISGTGENQTRTITGYVGATKVATVSAGSTDWSPTPDNTSVYVVVPGGDIVSDTPVPLPPLSTEEVYETLTLYDVVAVADLNDLDAADLATSFALYDIATVADVNGTSGSVVIDADDLMDAVITGHTATPHTLGWLWDQTKKQLP